MFNYNIVVHLNRHDHPYVHDILVGQCLLCCIAPGHIEESQTGDKMPLVKKTFKSKMW